jgi:hypothetical protein
MVRVDIGHDHAQIYMADTGEKIERYMRQRQIVISAWRVSLFTLPICLALAALAATGDNGELFAVPLVLFMAILAVNCFAILWKGVPRRCPFCDSRIEGAAYPILGTRCPFCEMTTKMPLPIDTAFPVVIPARSEKLNSDVDKA